MAVTLINVFSVPGGKEAEFVQWWNSVKSNITAQEGFISGQFHRSIKPESRYNFISSNSWASRWFRRSIAWRWNTDSWRCTDSRS